MSIEHAIEKAEEIQRKRLDNAIEEARDCLDKALTPTGFCLYCEEPLEEGQRFCDKECAKDAQTYGTYDGKQIK